MASDGEAGSEARAEWAPLSVRNELHHTSGGFEHVDWSKRGVLISPDYNSTSGESIRIIGYSTVAEDIDTFIVLEPHEGTEYGVNSRSANARANPLRRGQLRRRVRRSR